MFVIPETVSIKVTRNVHFPKLRLFEFGLLLKAGHSNFESDSNGRLTKLSSPSDLE